MKIVAIFAPGLYSFHYETYDLDEFNRLMDLWTDVSYLYQYANENHVKDIEELVFIQARNNYNYILSTSWYKMKKKINTNYLKNINNSVKI